MGCRVRAFWANVRTAVDPIRQEDPNPVLPLEKQFILAEDTTVSPKQSVLQKGKKCQAMKSSWIIIFTVFCPPSYATPIS